jgi:tetratricopeptide (TPR) repeat protein
LDSALSDCNQLLRLAPNNALPLSNRRLIELLTEQYDKAVLDCHAALKLNPKSAFSL